MFQLRSAYQPTGDQPDAIRQLVDGVRAGAEAQTLLGVTGSGKTFTIANVISEINRPTLILSHNKTLAAQLYSEMRQFFPNNAVEYFVSYYDYYQPEAYIPTTDTYIEKDLSINEEIDRLRLSAISALLSGRKDVIVVSSVSCLYGIGNPQDFSQSCISVSRGEMHNMSTLLNQLVESQYIRNDNELNRGRFRVKGDTVDIALAYADYILRIEFFGNEVDAIMTLDLVTNEVIEEFDTYNIYVPFKIPATLWNLLAHIIVLIGIIIGIPPATAASYKITLLFSFAKSKSLAPYLASNSLFAVTMCFPFLIAVSSKSKVGSQPPITSTIMSISGSFTKT